MEEEEEREGADEWSRLLAELEGVKAEGDLEGCAESGVLEKEGWFAIVVVVAVVEGWREGEDEERVRERE